MKLVLSTEEEKCILLKELGINVNMAPVCDITTKSSAFMYQRSLGQSPEITGDFASGVCNTMASYGIGSVLKHFPGYGNNADTHTGIAKDKRTLEELENCDLIPFAMAIENGCDAILVSHTIVQCLDPEYPASLSPAVHRYLRSEMVFGGVIVTDDLYMQAITDVYGHGEAAVLAVLAGNDLLCVTNYATQYKAVLAAVEEGRIPLEQVDLSVERILRWKYRLGLFADADDTELT
jgi:beta-N-acetylhexosaminidase